MTRTHQRSGIFRSIPGWLWLVIIAVMLTQTSTNLLRPVTSYKLIALGWGEAEIGYSTAAFALLPLFIAMPMGRMVGKLKSLKGFVATGAALCSGGGAWLALTADVFGLMAGSALLGLGHLMFTIGGQFIVARRSRAVAMDANFGWFTAGFSIGQMAGPLLSGLLLGNVSLTQASAAGAETYHAIMLAMWVGTATSLLAIPVLLGLRPSRPGTTSLPQVNTDDPRASQKPTSKAILRTPGMVSHMLAALALLAVLDILIAFMPLVGERLHVAPTIIGALLATRGAASVISRLFISWFTTRYSRNLLVLGSLFVSAVTIALVPPSLGWGDIGVVFSFVMMFIGGLFLGLGQPLTMTQISQSVPVPWRGSALALRLVGNRLGQILLPVAAGLIAAPLGPAGGIWFASAILAASGIERVVNKHTGPNEDPQPAPPVK